MRDIAIIIAVVFAITVIVYPILFSPAQDQDPPVDTPATAPVEPTPETPVAPPPTGP